MSSSSLSSLPAGDHSFIAADLKSDKRSPCPALNALANHGYISRRGTHITFKELLHAVRNVYNLTLPLGLLLTLAGFLTCAKFSLNLPSREPTLSPRAPNRAYSCRGYRWRLSLSWTLDLADLSARGWYKITHDASLVHPSFIPSHAPDPILVKGLLLRAASPPPPETQTGMSLHGLARVHAAREQRLPRPLSSFQEQVAIGECALGWLVMRDHKTGVVDLDALKEWLGEERLPEGWWDSRRPHLPVGLWQARRNADQVKEFLKSL
ncbi:hypothetical protein C8R44DRAFT_655594 [Mycena epipterygia]|nr:hypothetical protein C8R44DRAFT_655594 [Mycena epipterygia]